MSSEQALSRSDSAPLSEGRSVPSSTGRDEGAGTRSPGLDFFRVNPFRTLRVPIRIPAQEALWKSEKALSRLRAGLEAPEPDLVPWLAPPDEFDIREGAQKMEEPLRRLREQLLWFDFEQDPHGKLLEEALSEQQGVLLGQYLQNEDRAIAHRVNQANVRLLLGLSAMHGVELVNKGATNGARRASPPSLQWKEESGIRLVLDPHVALANASAHFPDGGAGKLSRLADALGRWGGLLKDPEFTPYIHAEIESLGDELVGKDDVDTITYAVSTALADIVVGEARLLLSRGAVDQVLDLVRIAVASGIDPVFWSTAFRPLKQAFQSDVSELEPLLDGGPRINDVDLYLSRLEGLTRPWSGIRDEGILGLDQIVDVAVVQAIDAIRSLDHPAVVLERIFEVLGRAERIARSESARERSREYRTVLEKYKDVLCHYCQKRGADLEKSVVLKGKKLVSSQYVGYNTIRNTFSLTAGFIPRCGTCAELHSWMHFLTRAMWVAAIIGAPFLVWVCAERGAVVPGLTLAALLLGASWGAKLIVARKATPEGETPYWNYQTTQGYRRIAGDGYSITKHDYRKDAYDRLKIEGLNG
jgi:hypothetical protein